MKRTFGILNLLLFLWMVLFGLWAWPRLPQEIPTHFGLNGEADAWSPRTLISWFHLPTVALLLALFMGAVGRTFRWKPEWVKLPDGRRLAELPPAARPPVVEMMEGFMALVTSELLAMFVLIQWAAFRTASGLGSQGIMITVLILAVSASPIFLVVFFLRLPSALRRGEELAATEADGTSS